VTSDCPLIDPILMDQVIDFTLKKQLDYASNILVESYPDGQDIEVIKFNSLGNALNKLN
jgi:spore coat polysaccharide biosynthesis protein SpsF (cytidylyltransferase family)